MLFVSLSTVHSSMVPNWLNMVRTSFSLYFLDTMPTNSFLSAKTPPKDAIKLQVRGKLQRALQKKYLFSLMLNNDFQRLPKQNLLPISFFFCQMIYIRYIYIYFSGKIACDE